MLLTASSGKYKHTHKDEILGTSSSTQLGQYTIVVRTLGIRVYCGKPRKGQTVEYMNSLILLI